MLKGKLRQERVIEIQTLIREIASFEYVGQSEETEYEDHQFFMHKCRDYLIRLRELSYYILPENEKRRLNAIKLEDTEDYHKVFEVHSRLQALLPDISLVLRAETELEVTVDKAKLALIDETVIKQLAQVTIAEYNTDFLSRLCNEVNLCFIHNSVIGTALLIRAILNYVPPIFKQKTFEQVVAQSSKSRKKCFRYLEEGLRPLADNYTHRTIVRYDQYPTSMQIESFKPALNFLLQEVVKEIQS